MTVVPVDAEQVRIGQGPLAGFAAAHVHPVQRARRQCDREPVGIARSFNLPGHRLPDGERGRATARDIVGARHVLCRQGITARVPDAVLGAADGDGIVAVLTRPDKQAVGAVPLHAGGGVASGIPEVEHAPGIDRGAVQVETVGPARLQPYREPVGIPRQLYLALRLSADIKDAGLTRGVVVRARVRHQQFIRAGAVSLGGDADVHVAIAVRGKEHAAVQPGARIVIPGAGQEDLAGAVDTEQIRIRQGPGPGRRALQVDAVGLAGLQADLEPVSIAADLNRARGRVADMDNTRGGAVWRIIVRHQSMKRLPGQTGTQHQHMLRPGVTVVPALAVQAQAELPTQVEAPAQFQGTAQAGASRPEAHSSSAPPARNTNRKLISGRQRYILGKESLFSSRVLIHPMTGGKAGRGRRGSRERTPRLQHAEYA